MNVLSSTRSSAGGGRLFLPLLGALLIVAALVCAAATASAAPSELKSAQPAQPVRAVGAKANSTWSKATADLAIDGRIADDSRWISNKSQGPLWLEIDLGGTHALGGVHVYSGYQQKQPLRDFVVQFRGEGGAWVDIPSARVSGNRSPALAIAFDDAVAVRTDRLRLWITGTHDGAARVLEVVVWPLMKGGIPPVRADVAAKAAAAEASLKPVEVPLYLNQSGFNAGAPKRFTAPTLPDGTRFEVRAAGGGGPALFSGELRGHIGDFSAFEPGDARDYVVAAGPHVSVPFRIGPWWLERVTYQNAVNFMIDSRHHVGNWRQPCRGSFGWRDDHHFGWELHTLVPQWLSNPEAYARMPRQIVAEKPSDPKLWGALEPCAADAPDLVKLIHWGADVIVTQGATHELLKSQLAYFLYAWPWLKAWMPEQNYAAVQAFAFAHWGASTCDREYPYDESAKDGHDLFATKTKVGTTKGAYPPGFSVQPNLLMHEVAKREGRADAERYFEAARRQVEWMVERLDWNDPLTTKGQRMSEFVTLTGLAHFLSDYPDRAPAGLAAKIEAWADVAIRRSANLWDFRKLDDGDGWTPMGDKPTMWNEPGNVLGLPAALLAALPHVATEAKRARLWQLVWSHFDNGFGRNPTGRHFSYDAPREIEGVEYGWYSYHHGGIGQLAEARFVFDGAPKNGHYPYHPEVGNIGWTEGWVQFNAAYNISLAYLAHAGTRVELRREQGRLVVRLRAPLNFDYARAETARVTVACGGDAETVLLTEEAAGSEWLSGSIQVLDTKARDVAAGASRGAGTSAPSKGDAARPGDGVLQAAPGAGIEASYGFGYLARRARL